MATFYAWFWLNLTPNCLYYLNLNENEVLFYLQFSFMGLSNPFKVVSHLKPTPATTLRVCFVKCSLMLKFPTTLHHHTMKLKRTAKPLRHFENYLVHMPLVTNIIFLLFLLTRPDLGLKFQDWASEQKPPRLLLPATKTMSGSQKLLL